MSRLRFVVLRHEHEGVHYDLMFETESVLKTWKIAEPPDHGKQSATRSFDHRLAYLDYEGPISGGRRGSVARWDAGTYEGDAGHESLVEVSLEGNRLRGRLTLRRLHENEWELEPHF